MTHATCLAAQRKISVGRCGPVVEPVETITHLADAHTRVPVRNLINVGSCSVDGFGKLNHPATVQSDVPWNDLVRR